jgi:hypothetical protein
MWLQIMQAATHSSGMGSKLRHNFRRSATLVLYFVRDMSVHSRVGAPHIEGQILRVSKLAPQHSLARDVCSRDLMNKVSVGCLADRIGCIRVCIGGQEDRVRGGHAPRIGETKVRQVSLSSRRRPSRDKTDKELDSPHPPSPNHLPLSSARIFESSHRRNHGDHAVRRRHRGRVRGR